MDETLGNKALAIAVASCTNEGTETPTGAGLTLSVKREAFARHYAAHGNATAAFRAAFDAGGMKTRSVRELGYRMSHEPAVRARVRALLDAAAEGATISARTRMLRLQLITEADPGELVRVVSECCRHCHGQGHAYQWVDLAEYCAALDAAEAKNEGRLAQRKRPRALPCDEGGYGFDPSAEPVDGCPRCFGRGTQRVVVTDTDRLSASARALLKGVRQKSTGEVEVLFHDQLTASDQLNRMQSAYVERHESRNLTLHATLPPTREVSTDELLALWKGSRL